MDDMVRMCLANEMIWASPVLITRFASSGFEKYCVRLADASSDAGVLTLVNEIFLFLRDFYKGFWLISVSQFVWIIISWSCTRHMQVVRLREAMYILCGVRAI